MTTDIVDFDAATRKARGEEVYRDNAHRRSLPGRVAQLAATVALEALREADRVSQGAADKR